MFFLFFYLRMQHLQILFVEEKTSQWFFKIAQKLYSLPPKNEEKFIAIIRPG